MEELSSQLVIEGRSKDMDIEEGRIIHALEERRKHEEIIWRKRSCNLWLKQGERNNQFFQRPVLNHRHQKKILYLCTSPWERLQD